MQRYIVLSMVLVLACGGCLADTAGSGAPEDAPGSRTPLRPVAARVGADIHVHGNHGPAA